jgi:hypothetical protein
MLRKHSENGYEACFLFLKSPEVRIKKANFTIINCLFNIYLYDFLTNLAVTTYGH